MFERGPVQPREGDRLLPGGLVAGIDVDERERRVPRVVELRGPRVDLEGGLVAEPAHRRDPVGEQVRVRLAILPLLDPGLDPAVQPTRHRVGQVLLPEAGTAGSVGKAVEVERPVGKVRQDRRGDPGEVADQLALRDRLLARVLERREEDLVEVRELEVLSADPPDALLAELLECLELRFRRGPRVLVGCLSLRRRPGLGHRGTSIVCVRDCRGFRGLHRRAGLHAALADDRRRVAALLDPLERGLANDAVT